MKLRAIVALSVAAVTVLFAPVAAYASPAQYPPTVCATLSVSTTHPMPGETITVSGTAFEPNTSIRLELHSRKTVLKTVTSDSTGAFSTSVTLPFGVDGAHALVAATGGQGPGCPDAVMLHFQTQGTAASTSPGGGHHGGTSFTGVDVLIILLVAAALIGAGVVLTRGGKRKHGSGHPLID